MGAWGSSSEAFDDLGTVRVYVRAVDANGRLVKGNITKTFTVQSARVSDVARVLLAALSEEHQRHA